LVVYYRGKLAWASGLTLLINLKPTNPSYMKYLFIALFINLLLCSCEQDKTLATPEEFRIADSTSRANGLHLTFEELFNNPNPLN